MCFFSFSIVSGPDFCIVALPAASVAKAPAAKQESGFRFRVWGYGLRENPGGAGGV